jgi:hypothetical protein
VEVTVAGSDELVVRIHGLNDLQESLLLQRLPAAVEDAAGDTLRERIRHAGLTAAPPGEAPVRVLAGAPAKPRTARDLRASTRVLFERCLEVLNPRPLDLPSGDLVEALNNPHCQLEMGKHLFDCPVSLEDLVKTLKNGSTASSGRQPG